jgi:hypothetical protein
MRQIRFIAVIAFVFLFSAVADAQATRTWVSGVGDDVNPCSRTAPCKTFAGAISKTAAGGEINCLDSGGFGAVTIIKSMTIDCKGMGGGILGSLTTGILINGADAVVKIRSLNLNGAGNGINGIRVMAAARVNVEDVVIDGFTQSGILVGNSGAVKVVVSNSSIRNNAGSGINGASTGTADILVANSLLTGNGAGVIAGAGSTFRLSGNTISFNTTGLSAPAGKIFSFKNNSIDGNGTNGAPTSTVLQQ